MLNPVPPEIFTGHNRPLIKMGVRHPMHPIMFCASFLKTVRADLHWKKQSENWPPSPANKFLFCANNILRPTFSEPTQKILIYFDIIFAAKILKLRQDWNHLCWIIGQLNHKKPLRRGGLLPYFNPDRAKARHFPPHEFFQSFHPVP